MLESKKCVLIQKKQPNKTHKEDIANAFLNVYFYTNNMRKPIDN